MPSLPLVWRASPLLRPPAAPRKPPARGEQDEGKARGAGGGKWSVEGVLWGRRAASIRTRHGQGGGLPRVRNSSFDAGGIASHGGRSAAAAAVATADADDLVSDALGGDGGGGGEGAARRGLKVLVGILIPRGTDVTRAC